MSAWWWPFPSKAKAARQSPWIPTPPFVDGETWAQVGTTTSTITPRAAENLAAILGAVNAIASTISSLPAFVTLSDDTRAEQPDHPLQRLIDFGVSPDESWADFIEGLLASTLLRGNALAEVQTDQRGRLTGLRTLPWPQVTSYVDDSGTLMFDFIALVPPDQGSGGASCATMFCS